MRLYRIEGREFDRAFCNEITKYRFYSLYNSARGSWLSKEDAELEGKEHQFIIEHATGKKF